MLKFKKKDVLYLVLIVVATAMVFFTAGAFTADFIESTRLDTTVIEYVPATTPTTVTTTIENTTIATASTTIKAVTTTTITNTDVTKTSTTKTTASTTAITALATTTKTGKININSATKEELMTVSGIGEVYATRIIEYRETIGYYTSLEELLEIKGIGEKRLEKWKPFLTV